MNSVQKVLYKLYKNHVVHCICVRQFTQVVFCLVSLFVYFILKQNFYFFDMSKLFKKLFNPPKTSLASHETALLYHFLFLSLHGRVSIALLS